MHQYREAVAVFAEAQRLAESSGDASAAGVIDANLSSVYEQMGEFDAAAAYARRGAARLAGEERRLHLPKVLIHLASLRARQGYLEEAAKLFSEGIAGADAAGDPETYSLGWDRLGEESFKRGELARADCAFLEAWRIRKFGRLPALGTSYRNLGRLRLAQGDLRSAEALLDEAVARAQAPRGLMPTWDVYHARGLVRLAQGRIPGALNDLRVAVRLARAWRAGISPADATRAGSEQMTEPVHASLARAAAALYFRTGHPELLEESFAAVEENRALSLRALVAGGAGRREQLPPEYWETLARVQACEVALVRRPDDAEAAAQAEALRATLAAIENRTTPVAAATEPGILKRLQRALPSGSVYFGFQLGEPVSYLWAVDGAGAALYRLPGRTALAAAAGPFEKAVREADASAEARGERLYRTLFGSVAQRFTSRPRWLLALDDDLLALPLAALRVGTGYLVERHTLQVVSSAGLAAQAGGGSWRTRLAGSFLGLGDPVYNTADGRWNRAPRRYFGLFAARAGEGMQLPRLVGSGREVELCAAAWQRPGAVLLQGAQACKRSLHEALAARPAVAHVAAHVLESAQRSHHGLIALSLLENEGAEILDPAEIAAWDAPAGLVTLSGCSSGVRSAPLPGSRRQYAWLRSLGFSTGSGPALPDAGLAGLTRAWLAAGAGAVAATRWPTPDGTGALLEALYRHLRGEPEAGPVSALARAQVEMIKSGGWRSRPQYWGAYFVVSNQ